MTFSKTTNIARTLGRTTHGRVYTVDLIYCDQPYISETMRCVSDDFIKTIDD